MSWNSLYQKVYAPYSETESACVVESKTGKFYAGVLIENISYPLTIPAVQAACAICLSEEEIPAKIYVDAPNLEQLTFWVEEFNLEVIQTDNPPKDDLENLAHKIDSSIEIKSELKSLLKKAVTPNSDFPVAALLFTEEVYFEGVNVEASEWTKGICAERVALCKAVASGHTDLDRFEIHAEKGEISSPCGACRQVISEHMPYHSINLHHSDGTLSEHLSIDLLPFSFKSSILKNKK